MGWLHLFNISLICQGDLILETVCAIELAVKLGFYAKKLENISVVKTGS